MIICSKELGPCTLVQRTNIESSSIWLRNQPLINPLAAVLTDLQGQPLEGWIVRVYDQDPKPPENAWVRMPSPMSRDATRSASRTQTSRSPMWKAVDRMCSSGCTTGTSCWEKARSSATLGSGSASNYG